MPFAYPVALELSGRRAVVIGDAVAHGKVEGLVAAGASVSVVAEGPERALDRLESVRGVSIERRAYRPGDLADAFICVASSDDPAERAAIHAEATERGVLLNVMDAPPHCDFAAPAIVRRGDLVIAVSTGGRSPAVARRIREELEQRYGEHWAEVLDVVSDVRTETTPLLPDLRHRIRRWSAALDLEELERLVLGGRGPEARELLRERVLGENERASA